MADMAKVMSHKRLLAISAAGRVELQELVQRTWSFLSKIKRDEENEAAAERELQISKKDFVSTIEAQVILEDDL